MKIDWDRVGDALATAVFVILGVIAGLVAGVLLQGGCPHA